MKESSLTLDELSEETNVSTGKIRRYIVEGLVEGPHPPRGRFSRYGNHHVERLKAIRVLIEHERVPSKDLYRRLIDVPPQEVTELAARLREPVQDEGQDEGPASALDYILSVRAELQRSGNHSGVSSGESDVVDQIEIGPGIEVLVRGTPNKARLARIRAAADAFRRALDEDR